MVRYEDLKPTLMVEQRAAQEWAKAALAWGDAAVLWEVAVQKTPKLCEVRARWASAAMSWGSAAHAWVLRSDESWIPGQGLVPGNHAWTSGSCYWAVVAHHWALASVKWAVAARSYPACAGDSLPFAASAHDWASASVAWAKTQRICEARLFEQAMEANLSATAGDRAANLAASARAVAEHHAENHAARDGAADVAARARAGSVAVMENGEAAPPSPVTSSVAVAASGKATQETARGAHSVAGDEPSRIEKEALLQDHGRGDATGTSVNLSLAEDRAAAEKGHNAVPDPSDLQAFPFIPRTDPKLKKAPKPGREQQLQCRRQA